MKIILVKYFLPLLLAPLLLGGAYAQTPAKSAASEAASTKSKAPVAKKKKPVKKEAAANPAVTSKFLRGSEETASERNTRLKRECKGGVNAGVCAGYTR